MRILSFDVAPRPPVVKTESVFADGTLNLGPPSFISNSGLDPVICILPPNLLAPPIVVIPENIALPSTLILAPTPGLAPISIPVLAVTKPTESIFVTSSYVNVPPIVTLPL